MGGAVFIAEEYYHGVIKPVKMERLRQGLPEWQDFVRANINACIHEEHCLQCTSLIHLFDVKFRRFVPQKFFDRITEDLWNRLNTKYTSITSQSVELSNVTTAMLLKNKTK